jgi:hypothetical protein
MRFGESQLDYKNDYIDGIESATNNELILPLPSIVNIKT